MRIRAGSLVALIGALLLTAVGCHEDGELGDRDAGPVVDAPDRSVDPNLPAQYTIGLLMNVGGGADLSEIEFTVDKINGLGGVLGQVPLGLRAVDLNGKPLDDVLDDARALFDDPSVVAVIGPETTTQMMAIAPMAIEARKPLIAYKPTSSDILRAFAGSPFIWRTKPSDIFQIEWIVRHAAAEGSPSIGLVTSVERGAQSAFDWFGFKTRALGFDDADVHIEVYGADRSCTAATEAMLSHGPERVIVAATERADLACIVEALDAARTADGALPTRVIVADLGPDVSGELDVLADKAIGLEGWIATHHPDTDLEGEFADFRAQQGAADVALGPPSDAAAGHDAIILIAHGLEVSGGAGGRALADGIKTAVTSTGPAHGAHADGVQRTMEALRNGEPVDIVGAGGALAFDPDAGIDLLAGTLGYWRYEGPAIGFEVLAYVDIGAEGGEPPPNILDAPPPESFVAPAAPVEDPLGPATERPLATKALIVAASAGWENYRHQADALARYQRLKTQGLTDDDIILIGADDLADHPDNALPGVVRNVPGGPDLRAGAVYDYGVEVTPAQIADMLAGRASAETPVVLDLDGDTNLYIYIAGHGGLLGVVFGAETLEQGLTGAGSAIYEPAELRGDLCALRGQGRVRRVLVEIEACHAGVFGDADFFGIESGCGIDPLTGVVMLTAASTRENSLGHGYDFELAQWVGDEFSVRMIERLDQGGDPSLLDLYRDVYLSVAGSHAQLYNAAAFGDLTAVRPVGEFLAAPASP